MRGTSCGHKRHSGHRTKKKQRRVKRKRRKKTCTGKVGECKGERRRARCEKKKKRGGGGSTPNKIAKGGVKPRAFRLSRTKDKLTIHYCAAKTKEKRGMGGIEGKKKKKGYLKEVRKRKKGERVNQTKINGQKESMSRDCVKHHALKKKARRSEGQNKKASGGEENSAKRANLESST